MADAHVIGLKYSNDGGHNWSNLRERDLGDAGQFNKRLRFQRLGSFVERVYYIENSSPRHAALLGAVMVADTER